MVGKYTESQKRAIKKYFDKLKEQGRTRSHGDKEKKQTVNVHIASLQMATQNFQGTRRLVQVRTMIL